MADLTRRTLLRAGGALLVAPALVRASSLDMLPRAWSEGGWYRFLTTDPKVVSEKLMSTNMAVLCEYTRIAGFRPRGPGWEPNCTLAGLRFTRRGESLAAKGGLRGITQETEGAT